VTHQQARQIVARLADGRHGDDHDDDLEALLAYIAGQEAAETMDSATAGRVAHAADRRAHTADARSITNAHDIVALKNDFTMLLDAMAGFIQP